MARFFRRGFAIRAVVCGLLCSGLPFACGLPDYRFVDEATGGSSGVSRPRCATEQDCERYPNTKTCDPTGHCVECFDTPGVATTCPAGQYCNVNRCDIGCSSNAACPMGLTCDVASHRCRGCAADTDCTPGTGCKSGECVAGCTTEAPCPDGFTCCNGSCAAFGTSPLHCGSCGKACSDEQDCINGECGQGSGCKGWLADCDNSPGCEVNLRTDRKHCGDCATDCGALNCAGGSCTELTCASNTADCDGDKTTKCETVLTNSDNCGICHNACSEDHGKA
ncbi:MAG TPA: hypothetical protein VFQ35_17840, partial [Polyangiaceae bacterium]|nr:hypothetical protein [Polyangiaceae bacterium]